MDSQVSITEKINQNQKLLNKMMKQSRHKIQEKDQIFSVHERGRTELNFKTRAMSSLHLQFASILFAYLVSKLLPGCSYAPLDRDDGAIKKQPLVDQAEAPGADQVGLAEVVGRQCQLLQGEVPRALVLRRRGASAPLAPLH
jgi:hypothetical protein